MKKNLVCALLFASVLPKGVLSPINDAYAAAAPDEATPVKGLRQKLKDLPDTAQIKAEVNLKYDASKFTPGTKRFLNEIEVAARRDERDDEGYRLERQLKALTLQQKFDEEQKNLIHEKERRLKEISDKLAANQERQKRADEEKDKLAAELAAKAQQAQDLEAQLELKAQEVENEKDLKKEVIEKSKQTMQEMSEGRRKMREEAKSLSDKLLELQRERDKVIEENKLLEEEKGKLLGQFQPLPAIALGAPVAAGVAGIPDADFGDD